MRCNSPVGRPAASAQAVLFQLHTAPAADATKTITRACWSSFSINAGALLLASCVVHFYFDVFALFGFQEWVLGTSGEKGSIGVHHRGGWANS
jgi:hypothetical protein